MVSEGKRVVSFIARAQVCKVEERRGEVYA